MTTIRELTPEFDNKGNPSWKTRLTAPDDSYALIKMIPDRIIPVIFVPGVMGSNLQGTGDSKQVQWLLDNEGSMSWDWALADEKQRKKHLTPNTMRVLDTGKIDVGQSGIPKEEFKRRGWGEVGFMSYGSFLPWLEQALNDYQNPAGGERSALRQRVLQALTAEAPLTQDEYELSYKYRFPVYACGYNWLDSNAVAAERLGQCIDAILRRYKNQKQKCEKVIIVTHSMGGLVARHCSEVKGYRDLIFGMVHGVMPAIGTAAVYRRFKAGSENFNSGFLKASSGSVGAAVLGSNAAEMTAVLSTAPGPLQLLPTPEYGNGWLKIKDGSTEHSLPTAGDPYGEIYTVPGKWWSMAEKHLINPLNNQSDSKKRRAQEDADWGVFKKVIEKQVLTFHAEINGKYHPNTYAFIGNSDAINSVGNVRWQRIGLAQAPTDTLNARPIDPTEIGERRSTRASLLDSDTEVARRFRLEGPDETGDGTVPLRSGISAKQYCKSFMQVKIEHEPAYQFTEGADYARACRFTLRAIVKIAQEVQKTSLKYD